MSDSGHAGRLKRSRGDMDIEPATIKVVKPNSSSDEAGGFDRDSNFPRGRSAFNPMRPVLSLGRNATAHSAPPSGALTPGEKSATPSLKKDHDPERKPILGKFSIRSTSIGSGTTALPIALAASRGADKVVGASRRGASGVATSNGTMAAHASTNADTSKSLVAPPGFTKERIRIVGGSANGSGAGNSCANTGQSSSVTSGGQSHQSGKTGGKAIKILPASLGTGASSGITKSNGKGKNKSFLHSSTVRFVAAGAQHGNGGAATLSHSGVPSGSASRAHNSAYQDHHQPSGSKKTSSSVSPSANSGGGGHATGTTRSEIAARSSPVMELPPPAERSVSRSPSIATDGDGEEPSEDGSGKVKRRRRTLRVPTPPPGWKFPPSSGATNSTVVTSSSNNNNNNSSSSSSSSNSSSSSSGSSSNSGSTTSNNSSSKTQQERDTPEASDESNPSCGSTATPTGPGGGAGGRRSRRPPSGGGTTPTNGKHVTDASAAGGKGSGGGSVGPVKKRSRPLVKEEPRPSTSSGAEPAQHGGSVSGGKGSGGRAARGRAAGRGRGKARARRRVLSLLESVSPRGPSNKARDTMRWRTHRMVEDYVNTCGSIMYPKVTVGPFGYRPCDGRFPLERPSTLGMMRTELRRPTVIEKWSPYQVALFEGAISIHGKVFHKVSREVEGKTTQDVIEFYYMWKKTNHYKKWKAMWRSEQAILQPPDDDSDDGGEATSNSEQATSSSTLSLVGAARAGKGVAARGSGSSGRKSGGGQQRANSNNHLNTHSIGGHSKTPPGT